MEPLFNWNVFPSTRLEYGKLVTPIACLLTPFSEAISSVPTIDSFPLRCSSCNNYINPLIKLDRINRRWWCPFCNKQTNLPFDYQIPESPTNVDDWPVELRQSSTTITYNLPQDITKANEFKLGYVFVVDLYQHGDIKDFGNLKNSLISALQNIPNGSYFSLVTFDESVCLHTVDSSFAASSVDIPKDINRLFLLSQILATLSNLNLKLGTNESPFISQLSEETKAQFVAKITDLEPKNCQSYRSSPRATGFALYLTSLLLGNSWPNLYAKVSLFTSGPATAFPGNIVDESNQIRSHNDLIEFKNNCPESTKFYEALAYVACGLDIEKAWSIASSNSAKTTKQNLPQNSATWTYDIFVGSVEQAGLLEMKLLVQVTMGNLYIYDNWQASQFTKSLLRSLEVSTINSTLTVATSTDFKVAHLLGGGYHLPSTFALEEKGYEAYTDKISDRLTAFDASMSKKNFTNRWYFTTLCENDTLAIYFELDTAKSWSQLTTKSTKQVYSQFQLHYWDISDKRWKLRITTILKPTTFSLPFPSGKGGNILREIALLKGFNQKAWVVLLARLVVTKLTGDLEEPNKSTKLLDDSLIRLLHHFGGVSFKVDNIAEYSANPYLKLNQIYKINENFHLLPSLIYSLRKNPQLLQIFNSSPDETTYNHLWFLKADVNTSISMIKPDLYKLVDGSDAVPIALDIKCLNLQPKTWLVLDSIFQIVIYLILDKERNGKLPLHASHNEDLIDKPEFAVPFQFINKLLQNRSRIGKIIITQTNHSQARYLTSRLNPEQPSLTKELAEMSLLDKSAGWLGIKKVLASGSQQLMTEDISLPDYYNEIINKVKKYVP